MTRYYRIMSGAGSAYTEQCLSHGFIGGDWDYTADLTGRLPEDFKTFNEWFIPHYQATHPGKTKISAGLAGGMLWTITKGLSQGDVILTPDTNGVIHFGTITSDYTYVPDGPLPHRRAVAWQPVTVHRSDLSGELQASMRSTGTVANMDKHSTEIDTFLTGATTPPIIATRDDIIDPTVFALEKHLEEFLITNWNTTELAQRYRIFTEDGEMRGQQYLVDTGNIDILAISHDGTELLVIELKKGRASDAVVGQIQRYMGYIQAEIAEGSQKVRGVIIALDDDKRIQRALTVAPNIDFYRYHITFTLEKV